MKNPNTIRLRRIQTKEGITKGDEKAIFEPKIRKNDDVEEIRGIDELKKQGNIEEAFAVFTKDGMNLLIDTFVDAVEQKIEEALKKKIPTIVEGMIEEKIHEVIRGLRRGQMMFAEERTLKKQIAQVVGSAMQMYLAQDQEEDQEEKEEKSKPDVPNENQEQSTDLDEESKVSQSTENKESKPNQTDNSAKVAKKRKKAKRPRGTIRMEAKIVAEVLREHGKPMRRSDLIDEAEKRGADFYNRHGATSKLKRMMEYEPTIRSVGKGLYAYVEEGEEETYQNTLDLG